MRSTQCRPCGTRTLPQQRFKAHLVAAAAAAAAATVTLVLALPACAAPRAVAAAAASPLAAAAAAARPARAAPHAAGASARATERHVPHSRSTCPKWPFFHAVRALWRTRRWLTAPSCGRYNPGRFCLSFATPRHSTASGMATMLATGASRLRLAPRQRSCSSAALSSPSQAVLRAPAAAAVPDAGLFARRRQSQVPEPHAGRGGRDGRAVRGSVRALRQETAAFAHAPAANGRFAC